MTKEQALAEIETLKPLEAEKWQTVSRLIEEKLSIIEAHQKASSEWMEVSQQMTQLINFINLLSK